MSLEQEQQTRDRVCGWLVCIRGSNLGVGYSIRAGKNFIGSDPNMDIYIKNDKKIDKYNHAVVMYDQRTRKTMLLPGDSKGMVYLENEAVYRSIELSSMSLIELGDSSFYFVPFCREGLDWEDIIQD